MENANNAASDRLHDQTRRPGDHRERIATDYAGLSTQENDFQRHMDRWGSDGYPVQKIGRSWQWGAFCGVKGAPTVYKTKRECVAAVEAFIDVLRDKSAGRL